MTAARGARFWQQVFSELKYRGVTDVLIAVRDGLKGLPVAAVFGEPSALFGRPNLW